MKSFLLLTGFPSHSLLKGDFFKDTLLIVLPFYYSFPVTVPFIVPVTGNSFRESLLQGVLSESCCYRASFVPRMADIVGRNAITMAINMTETKKENFRL